MAVLPFAGPFLESDNSSDDDRLMRDVELNLARVFPNRSPFQVLTSEKVGRLKNAHNRTNEFQKLDRFQDYVTVASLEVAFSPVE